MHDQFGEAVSSFPVTLSHLGNELKCVGKHFPMPHAFYHINDACYPDKKADAKCQHLENDILHRRVAEETIIANSDYQTKINQAGKP